MGEWEEINLICKILSGEATFEDLDFLPNDKHVYSAGSRELIPRMDSYLSNGA